MKKLSQNKIISDRTQHEDFQHFQASKLDKSHKNAQFLKYHHCLKAAISKYLILQCIRNQIHVYTWS